MNNKNIKTMVIAGLACVALCGTTLAAPHGGNGRRAPHRAAPARHEVVRHKPPRPARHVTPPRPHYTVRRHWARPVCPPPRYGALRAWTWIDAAWNMIIDGVCYYGDGYYYDGYNYYYNGAYYTTPPAVTTIIAPPTVTYW